MRLGGRCSWIEGVSFLLFGVVISYNVPVPVRTMEGLSAEYSESSYCSVM